MTFVASNVLAKLPTMTRGQVDALDFGVVKMDDSGTIQLYNKYESELACVAPAHAEGKNFFTQIAPCTNNRMVYGKFNEGVQINKLDSLIPYTFTYKMQPTNVDLHLYRDVATKTNWLLVKKK